MSEKKSLEFPSLIPCQETQDEETSDCPLLTPSPEKRLTRKSLELTTIVNCLDDDSLEMETITTSRNINTVDGLENVYMNLVNSSSKPFNYEPTSRDPMVESTSSSNSSRKSEQVCAQLLNQLNEAYQHLAPDAQALENGGKPSLVGIQLMVPKSPKDYSFTNWNWPIIRKSCFWLLMSTLVACTALVIGIIITMPKRCNPSVKWWQGSLFYEIFPASFQDGMGRNDGIGDLPGISQRLDYIKGLGVKAIRLNSIFPSPHYPEHYMNVTTLKEVNVYLGVMKDFENLVKGIHARNMTLILDLPLYPLIRDLKDSPLNRTSHTLEQSREVRSEVALTVLPTSVKLLDDLSSSKRTKSESLYEKEDAVASILEFWLEKGVDGFYLKGLEHYIEKENFNEKLKYWSSILGPNRILICNVRVLEETKEDSVRDVLLSEIDLVDIMIRVSNGTDDMKNQIDRVINGILFSKSGYPWIHWSVGSVDTERVASTLKINNASLAVTLMIMMLPGTPSIFYGDEKGILNCPCPDHLELKHIHQLSPMHWEEDDDISNGPGDKFSSYNYPWLSETSVSLETSLRGIIKNMSDLRSETPSIYVRVSMKNDKPVANCNIRYTKDELIVIERRLRRRNSYIFIGNFGNRTQTKDLSNLYYGGHVIVGPKYKLNKEVIFKELNIPPGEAFVIKLDK